MAYQDILKANLIQAEGKVSYAYRDSQSYLSIGIGHLIDQRKGGKISDAAIDFIFDEDCTTVESEATTVVPSFDTLSDTRKAAITEMIFNLGEGGLEAFTTFLGLIAAGDFAGAADDLAGTKWAAELPGRSKRIADMIRSG